MEGWDRIERMDVCDDIMQVLRTSALLHGGGWRDADPRCWWGNSTRLAQLNP